MVESTITDDSQDLQCVDEFYEKEEILNEVTESEQFDQLGVIFVNSVPSAENVKD